MEEAVSVSALTHAIRALLQEAIGDIVVEGEISNYKHHASGHRYFTLKDDEAQIQCVMWRTRSLAIRPEDGMKVIAFGRLTVYPPMGRYQIDVVALRPAGVGTLQQVLMERRRRLQAAGYFAWERKRALPSLPMTVGVVTSASGAALQDILRTIANRMPLATVVVRPTLVQGDGAAEDIAAGIAAFAASGVDVLIVGRGGGSIEDLWAFNEEVVATAIYNCPIPVISAVGHETDETIADLVADVRAATPTHAAVLVTPLTRDDVVAALAERRERMRAAMADALGDRRDLVRRFLDGRSAARLQERISLRMQRTDDVTARMERTLRQRLASHRQRIDHVRMVCTTLHPLAPLRRGFAVIERHGNLLTQNEPLLPGETITLRRRIETSTLTVTSTTTISDATHETLDNQG